METETSFGAWIGRRRKHLDLTRKELANRVGCSISALQKIEKDERRPSREMAERLAEFLQISANQREMFVKVARGERITERLEPFPHLQSYISVTSTGGQVSSLRTSSSRPPLPASPNLLIGRSAELSEIANLLDDFHCRLLTLTGQGGIGKTRLALQAATNLQQNFSHGTAFVPLASINNREQIVTAIADALGFVLYGATDRSIQLIDNLREKSVLIVLDNFEHLLSNSTNIELVREMLQGASNIKFLTTSREPLQLQAEWVFEVQGLPLPVGQTTEELDSSALQLFMQRARQVRVGFSINEGEKEAVLRICQLVQGLPLGIELAAAWVRTLSCVEIAAEIERSLDFLAVYARDIPERHRSTRAVFDHSWQLLSEEEQRVLQNLAIFRGGFSRDAAIQVADASLPVLMSLVNKSLVQYGDVSPPRYNLHELVRQYAFSHLQTDWEAYTETADRHSQYFAHLLERHGPALKGHERPRAVLELVAELANIRLSWAWAATQQKAEALSRSADTLFWLYESRCNCREGVPLFGQAVDNLADELGAASDQYPDEMPALARGQALSYQGFFYFRQGQPAQGRERLQDSLNILTPLAEAGSLPARIALSNTKAFFGTVISAMGEFVAGRQLLYESLAEKQALLDEWGAAFCLRQLGITAHALGEFSEARQMFGESLTLCREMENTWATAASLNLLGMVAHAEGAYHEAQSLLEEGLALSQEVEDRFNMAFSLKILGLVAQDLGDFQKAAALLGESIAFSKEIGDHGTMAETINDLGNALFETGTLVQTRNCFLQALQIAFEAEVTPIALDALMGLAKIDAIEGTKDLAAEWLLIILQNPAGTQETKTRANALLKELQRQDPSLQINPIHERVVEKKFESYVRNLLSMVIA